MKIIQSTFLAENGAKLLSMMFARLLEALMFVQRISLKSRQRA
jgi:hypothetical protein